MLLVPLKRLRHWLALVTVPALVLVALGLATAPASAAIVTITSNGLTVGASAGSGDSFNFDASTALNRTNTITAVNGGSTSSTTLTWTGNDGFAVLDFRFTHERAGSLDSYAQTYATVVRFVAEQNTTYVLSGNYGMTGNQQILSDAWLRDVTSFADLFRDYSESRYTPNEQFVLGVAGDGDFQNYNLGNLTGILIAGRTYELSFNDYVQANPISDGGASASGLLRLEIGSPLDASVPESSSILAWAGLGVLGLAGGVMRRRAFRRSAANSDIISKF